MANNKGRLPPFVPLLIATLDSPAWKALSHGAKSLYVTLKRRVPNGRNRAYVSYREAAKDMGAGKTPVSRWFAELQHYGFIILLQPGCLGTDGKGKAPHWQLTELGQTSKASAGGLFEPPTNEFLKWDGTKFRIPSPHRGRGVPPWRTGLSPHEGQAAPKLSPHVGHRKQPPCPPIEDITSLTTIGRSKPKGRAQRCR